MTTGIPQLFQLAIRKQFYNNMATGMAVGSALFAVTSALISTPLTAGIMATEAAIGLAWIALNSRNTAPASTAFIGALNEIKGKDEDQAAQLDRKLHALQNTNAATAVASGIGVQFLAAAVGILVAGNHYPDTNTIPLTIAYGTGALTWFARASRHAGSIAKQTKAVLELLDTTARPKNAGERPQYVTKPAAT